jgi:hypothetical protein
MAELQMISVPPVQRAMPGIARAGEKAQPALRDTVRELLSMGKLKMLLQMGQPAVDELTNMLRDVDEELFRRSDAVDALREMMARHETLDCRKALGAFRWVARHEKNMELIESATDAFRQITGSYPSQCNGIEYKDDRD